MPKSSTSRSLYEGMTACMIESRRPRRREVEAVAAKIWREAYGSALHLAWENVEVGSACYRRMIAAATVALDPPEARVWPDDAAAA